MIKFPKINKISDKFSECFRPEILRISREIIEKERKKAIKGEKFLNESEIFDEISREYENFKNLELKSLINATGIVIHTNFGRSVISPEILDRAGKNLENYTNLEYDQNIGKRGNRYDYTAKLFSLLFDAPDALVVNNNAAAVFLVLNTFCKNKECVVSRGELVEIGGSFRIPEVMANSGAILHEIGTTNKTKLQDYENAICENTALLMKVHRSNFAISGFTGDVYMNEISKLAKKRGLIDYFDIGSGFVYDLNFNLTKDEPKISDLLRAGVSLISFSGDKLFGGVQAGIILGSRELISKLRKNQLLRMLRVDKITLSLLAETIKAYINKEFELIPTVSMINESEQNLRKNAEVVAHILSENKISFEICKTETFVGGGSLACRTYPSVAIAFGGIKPEILEEKFRKNGVIGRIENEKFLLDFRSIFKKDLKILANKILDIFHE